MYLTQVGLESGYKEDDPAFNIPIFTEEFLDHNKGSWFSPFIYI